MPLSRPAIALAFSLAALGAILLLIGRGIAAGEITPYRTDFVPYFSAGHLIISGRSTGVYSLQQIGHFEQRLVAPLRVVDGVMPFLYPPYAAVALAPLALLPYATAFWVWFGINLVALCSCLVALTWYTGWTGVRRAALWTCVLAFFPIVLSLVQGQISILVLALLTVCFIAIRTGHEGAAGVCLALALIKPPLIAPVVLVLVVKRQWGTIAAFTLSAACLLAVPALLPGSPSLSNYLGLSRQAAGWTSQIGGFQARLGHGLPSQIALLVPGPAGTWLAVLAVALVLAGLVFLAARSPEIDLPFAAGVLTGILVSPHLLLHDLVVGILPTVLLLRASLRADLTRDAALGLAFVSPLLGLPLVGEVPVQLTVVATLLLGTVLWREARARWNAAAGEPAR